MNRWKTWSCKIGGRTAVPDGSDKTMRDAVERAYREAAGEDCLFLFSGFGAQLTEPELAVVEDREPSHAHEIEYGDWKATATMLAEALRTYVTAPPVQAARTKKLALEQFEQTRQAYA